jgi:hypothetical protein
MDEWLLKADDLLKARVLYDAERSLPEGALDAIKKRDLVAVVAALDQLSTTRAAVAARRERADTLVRRSIDDHRRAWDDAIAAIAKSERYSMPDGSPLVIEPQVGLVPLGENPTTRLWEFWVLDSGDEPLRKGSHFEIGPRTGVVLILMCGTAEHPFHPFFGGKYEVTQGQWRLVMGSNPSDMSIDRMHVAQSNANRKNVDDRHPVEMITWLDAEHFCALLALRLLPQTDWRHLAGGERTGGRWTGLDPLSLIGQENIRHDPRHTGFDEADNFPYHAPVGSLGCNEHGAFDMLANVAEWLGTADVEHADASDPTLNHFLGSGDYRSELEQVTAKSDWKNRADLKNSVTGVRAGRTLKPCPACLAEGKSGH